MSKQKPKQDIKNLGPDSKFVYKMDFAGKITYSEGSDALEVRDGRLYTKRFSKRGMKWNGTTWVVANEIFNETIVLTEDVPKGAVFGE